MFHEDLSVFFSTDEFAVEATWIHLGESAVVVGIFDEESARIEQVRAEGFELLFTCPASSVPGAKRKDTLIVNGTTYTVDAVKSVDGITHLVLGR